MRRSLFILVALIVFAALVVGIVRKAERRAPPGADSSREILEEEASDDEPRARGGRIAVNFPSDWKWIDVHMHCKPDFETVAAELGVQELVFAKVKQNPSEREKIFSDALPELMRRADELNFSPLCNPSAWAGVAREMKGGGVVLSLAFNAANGSLKVASAGMRGMAELVGDLTNDIYEASAKQNKNLYNFPSLDCWYDTPFGDASWLSECKKDVDEWVARGAIGFKDYVGGNFLEEFNPYNGFCSSAGACLTARTMRYPILEEKYRELVKYIVEEKGGAIVSHAAYNSKTKQCYDPLTKRVDLCGPVTIRHIVDFSEWMERNVSADARRRFIVAHLGLTNPSWHNRESELRAVLANGLSTDVSAQLEDLKGCSMRETFTMYPRQIMFGTDLRVNNEASDMKSVYESYFDALGGDWKSGGLDLDMPRVSGCSAVTPAGLLDDILKNNFMSLYES